MKQIKVDPIPKTMKPIGGIHGVSAIFPNFEDIINYEEKKIKLNRGYPRFITHPFVRKTELIYKRKFRALEVLCCHSFESAIFLILDFYFKKGLKISYSNDLSRKYLNFFTQKFPKIIDISTAHEADAIFTGNLNIKSEFKTSGKKIIAIIKDPNKINIEKYNMFDIIITLDMSKDVGIILFYNKNFSELLLLRRHIGLIASSRKITLKKTTNVKKCTQKRELIKKSLSKLELTNTDDCYLFPSGMSAVFYAIYSLISPKKSRFIALGSLYVDTIRILEKWPKKYGLLDSIFISEDFERNLLLSIDENTAGIILEFPSNPLIQLIDLEKIIKIAHEKNIKVIVDSTIGTPYNINPFNYDVDIIVHSTTKFLNGKNNHLGGIILTRDYKIKIEIEYIQRVFNITMDNSEIKILIRNLKNFEKRMIKINKNSLEIANLLNLHPAIEKVYYPCLKDNPNYNLARKYLRGGSGLISFKLKNSSYQIAEKFYDNVYPPILKGPSLGSEKTLLSPYVIMAHYNDSKEFLKQMGFDFYLMRISVGTESVVKIKESLNNALASLI